MQKVETKFKPAFNILKELREDIDSIKSNKSYNQRTVKNTWKLKMGQTNKKYQGWKKN